jgi:hypothetical protein
MAESVALMFQFLYGVFGGLFLAAAAFVILLQMFAALLWLPTAANPSEVMFDE